MPLWDVGYNMGRKRNDHGRFADGIPPEWVLEVFEDREDSARPLTASDIADALGCSRRAAHDKLEELAEEGKIATRKVGARARVWWLPLTDSDGDDQTAPAVPLQRIVGLLDDEEAEQARQRSQEWRDEFDREVMGGAAADE